MTYPPQQPGPYGQQDPWGQQQGPFPPQPPSQTPPWLADPGGFPSFEPDPKKRRTGLIVTIVIVVLVLGGGGFGLWMLLSKDDPEPSGGGGGGGDGGSDARAVAEKYVQTLEETVNTKIVDIDLSAMEPLTCADDFAQMEQEIGDAQAAAEEGNSVPQPDSIEAGMEDFESTEDRGSFTLTQKIDGESGPDQEMTMSKEDGDWKVCGLYASTTSPSESEPTEPEPGESVPPSGGEIPNPIPTG